MQNSALGVAARQPQMACMQKEPTTLQDNYRCDSCSNGLPTIHLHYLPPSCNLHHPAMLHAKEAHHILHGDNYR